MPEPLGLPCTGRPEMSGSEAARGLGAVRKPGSWPVPMTGVGGQPAPVPIGVEGAHQPASVPTLFDSGAGRGSRGHERRPRDEREGTRTEPPRRRPGRPSPGNPVRQCVVLCRDPRGRGQKDRDGRPQSGLLKEGPRLLTARLGQDSRRQQLPYRRRDEDRADSRSATRARPRPTVDPTVTESGHGLDTASSVGLWSSGHGGGGPRRSSRPRPRRAWTRGVS